MSVHRNAFLDHGFSDDDSDRDDGYDSEAAETLKGAKITPSANRAVKRRKLSQSEDDAEDVEQTFMTARGFASDESASDREEEQEDDSSNEHEQAPQPPLKSLNGPEDQEGPRDDDKDEDEEDAPNDYQIKSAATSSQQSSRPEVTTDKHLTSKLQDKPKPSKPGVVYLSSLPPYLKPSALRNLLTQRGFHPVTRLFLAPTSKAKTTSKRNSRQLYGEGWIEFSSRKTARRCAETLNASIVGGPKGGFYHDDLWNMKYLSGMGWDELMAGVREERREEEGRRDEERRVIARETKRFVDGVEEGRRVEGMKRKRRAKGAENGGGEDLVRRTWNQHGVKSGEASSKSKVSGNVQSVASKIF